MSAHTLVTLLGRGRDNRESGYRHAQYVFPDGARRETPYFGLALADHLRPDRLVILGTSTSMWDVLLEHHVTDGTDEDLRLELMDAVASARVDSNLLARAAPAMCRALARTVDPRLIPYGRDDTEQRAILQAIASAITEGRVSLDLTHAFRHLAMLGLLSSFMLERIGKLAIEGIWYGALEMTGRDGTPVLRLDGLLAIQRWIDAIDRFDASGDYGVFVPLLAEDGLPQDKADCLRIAAFHEGTLNVLDAARRLRTFLPVLDAPLAGASGLFQSALAARLAWVRAGNLAQQQKTLAERALARKDYLRAAILALEALVTRLCIEQGKDSSDYDAREAVATAFDASLRAAGIADRAAGLARDPDHDAFWTLKIIRNSLAHGLPPRSRRHRKLLAQPEALAGEIRRCINLYTVAKARSAGPASDAPPREPIG